MVIVSFSGKIGSGKDEAAKQFMEIFGKNHSFEEKAFADHLKKVVASLTKTDISFFYSHEGKNKLVPIWDNENCAFLVDIQAAVDKLKEITALSQEKNEIIHHNLSKILLFGYHSTGDKQLSLGELLQIIGEGLKKDFYKGIWVDKLFEEWTSQSNWVIKDIRDNEEINRIKKENSLFVKVFGDPKGENERMIRDKNHVSETSLDDKTDWDFVIDNSKDDISNLKRQVIEFISKYENFLSL